MYAVYKYVYLMCSTTTHRHPQTCWKWAGIKPRHHLQQRVAQIVHQPRMMKIIAQGRILAVSAGNLSSLRLIDMWYVYIYIVFGAKKQWCHMSWKKNCSSNFCRVPSHPRHPLPFLVFPPTIQDLNQLGHSPAPHTVFARKLLQHLYNMYMDTVSYSVIQ